MNALKSRIQTWTQLTLVSSKGSNRSGAQHGCYVHGLIEYVRLVEGWQEGQGKGAVVGPDPNFGGGASR